MRRSQASSPLLVPREEASESTSRSRLNLFQHDVVPIPQLLRSLVKPLMLMPHAYALAHKPTDPQRRKLCDTSKVKIHVK